MKRTITLLLALVMILAAFAGCANKKAPETTTEAPVAGPATALELLETVWGLYAENETFFVIGGDAENMVDGAPGAVNLELDYNPLFNLQIPDDQVVNFSEAAMMTHAMNVNTFACGAVKLAEGADASAVAQTIRDSIMNAHWMCGFPERMIVASVGEYIVVAFGLDGVSDPSMKIITTFENHLKEAYDD